MVETTQELCKRWIETHQRTAAFDSMVDEIRAHFKDIADQLRIQTATIEEALNILTSGELSDDMKMAAVKELLSTCHSGQLLKMVNSGALMDERPEPMEVNIDFAGLVIGDEFS